ncbi:MAG: hypothetical protein ICV60_02185 [Pyrinomonadaceae bacterium]|nr:hypothetical protein [Pyrinomonadaceae bacterium]
MWICKPCGKENRKDRIHCWSCSTPKDETAVMDEHPPSPFKTHNSESNFNSQVAKVSSAASQSSKPIPDSLNEYRREKMSNVSGGQDINSDTPFPTEIIYSDKSIWVGSAVGGPLVAGYIIARNFEAFDEVDKAKQTWIITIIATVFIFGVAFLVSDIEYAGKAIPGIYTGIAYILIRQYQGAKIDAHINAGGATHSWLNIAGISIVGLIITIIPVIGIALAAAPMGYTNSSQLSGSSGLSHNAKTKY